MPKLFDYVLSGSCYKVRLLLSMLGVQYETQEVDFYPGKEHKQAPFLAINPLGQLPAFEDDGIVLRDAQAILCHIANKYDTSGKWLPRDERFGPVMMWLMFAGGEIMAISAARMITVLRYPGDVEALKTKGRAALRVLEDHLTERGFEGGEWIVGDTPTIADVAMFPYVALSHDCGIGHEDYPAISMWQKRVRRLPGFVSMPGVPDYF
jgi:glutathione S-transferase